MVWVQTEVGEKGISLSGGQKARVYVPVSRGGPGSVLTPLAGLSHALFTLVPTSTSSTTRSPPSTRMCTFLLQPPCQPADRALEQRTPPLRPSSRTQGTPRGQGATPLHERHSVLRAGRRAHLPSQGRHHRARCVKLPFHLPSATHHPSSQAPSPQPSQATLSSLVSSSNSERTRTTTRKARNRARTRRSSSRSSTPSSSRRTSRSSFGRRRAPPSCSVPSSFLSTCRSAKHSRDSRRRRGPRRTASKGRSRLPSTRTLSRPTRTSGCVRSSCARLVR